MPTDHAFEPEATPGRHGYCRRCGAGRKDHVPQQPRYPTTPASFPAQQPLPTFDPRVTPTHELVIDDMRTRAEHGLAKYGAPLQPHNGRNSLQDLYEELLDATQYAKNELRRREGRPGFDLFLVRPEGRDGHDGAVFVHVDRNHEGPPDQHGGAAVWTSYAAAERFIATAQWKGAEVYVAHPAGDQRARRDDALTASLAEKVAELTADLAEAREQTQHAQRKWSETHDELIKEREERESLVAASVAGARATYETAQSVQYMNNLRSELEEAKQTAKRLEMALADPANASLHRTVIAESRIASQLDMIRRVATGASPLPAPDSPQWSDSLAAVLTTLEAHKRLQARVARVHDELVLAGTAGRSSGQAIAASLSILDARD